MLTTYFLVVFNLVMSFLYSFVNLVYTVSAKFVSKPTCWLQLFADVVAVALRQPGVCNLAGAYKCGAVLSAGVRALQCWLLG